MTVLLLGLLLFLGVHSVRIVADPWRSRMVARLGPGAWKGLYSLLAAVGLALIVWGYGIARTEPIVLWTPPLWTRHLASLLTLAAFVLLAAAYVPGTRIKAALGHPMLLGVKLWAAAHLIANGTLADVALFGAFLLWAVFCFRAARRRDRAQHVTHPARGFGRDAATAALGVAAWAAFAFHLHAWLIGVRPL
jgi:uncharacterized membrane protein